jgi:hypothetical protein
MAVARSSCGKTAKRKCIGRRRWLWFSQAMSIRTTVSEVSSDFVDCCRIAAGGSCHLTGSEPRYKKRRVIGKAAVVR